MKSLPEAHIYSGYRSMVEITTIAYELALRKGTFSFKWLIDLWVLTACQSV